MTETIWANTCTIYRDAFKARAEYLRAYRECAMHYAKKVRVEGGWKFFESVTDYKTWMSER